MKLLKFVPLLLVLAFFNSNAYAAQNCDEIKNNIVGKMLCKAKEKHATKSSSIDSSTTTESTKKKNGILSKIWKKPEWMKKKN